MLKDVTLWLVNQNFIVSVIGRNQAKFQKVAKLSSNPSHLNFLQVDYRNTNLLKEKVTEAIEEFGPLELIVSWIHSTAPNALEIILNSGSMSQEIELYQVISSSTRIISPHMNLGIPENYKNHFVQLGFVIDKEGSRWLSHKEISEGVIQAIIDQKSYSLVGVLEPWKLRP